MSVYIKSVRENSLAAKAGLKKKFQLLSINENPINNFLDLQFYANEEILKIKFIDNNDNLEEITIFKEFETNLGIEIFSKKCRTCCNNCIFCFVDQMPSKMRKSLYLKDDDYVFSFIYGNFITLTNLSNIEFDRIIEQHISPLYISVHTTNPILHKKMLRYKNKNFNILDKLKQLTAAGIQMHTQIVVVPGWNDGYELNNTLKKLTQMEVLSIGIVPVGLTKYRDNLPALSNVSPQKAESILITSKNYPNTFCSDELYLLAEHSLPSYNFYQDFPQLENGIGMLRLFLENWKANKQDFLQALEHFPNNLVFVTGELASKYIKKIVDEINSKIPNKARIKVIVNNFFGSTVTVSGLLTASDIFSQINLSKYESAVFSSNIFNIDNYTLDNVSHLEMKQKLGKFLVVDEEFCNWRFI